MGSNKNSHHNKISRNTQKILFAEDLVNFILQRYSIPAILFSSKRRRTNGVSLFDKNLGMAADFLNYTVGVAIDKTFDHMMSNNMNNIQLFCSYANTLKRDYILRDCYPASFFHYCVHLAHIAAKLYQQGIKEAPGMAVNYIIEVMDFDRFRSGKSILDQSAQKFAEIQRQLYITVEHPAPNRKEESSVQATDVQIGIPHHLRQSNVTAKNIHSEDYTVNNASNCEVNQHHVYNKNGINNGKMDDDISTNSSSSSRSESYSLQDVRKPVIDYESRNPYNEFSSCYIGVPGTSRDEPTHLPAWECYTAESIEDQNRQPKKPRLNEAENICREDYTGDKASNCEVNPHHVYNKNGINNGKMDDDISLNSSSSCQSQSYSLQDVQTLVLDYKKRNPNDESLWRYIEVPGLSCEEPINLHARESYSDDSIEDQNMQPKKPTLNEAENIHREDYGINNGKMDDDTSENSSSSSQSQSYSLQDVQSPVIDYESRNPYNSSSLHYIGVPGSPREERTNLHAQELHAAESIEDQNRQSKKPRLNKAENIRREDCTGDKASNCGVNQHHVYNKNGINIGKTDDDIAINSSS